MEQYAGFKGVKQIKYPSENMILRFGSKARTGEIILNNVTGLFEFDPPLEGVGVTVFTELTDTPSVYTGETGKVTRVNALESGLEFHTLTATDVGAIEDAPSDSNKYGRLDGTWSIIDESGVTNLSFTRDATTVTVESSTGTDAILPTATTDNAGVLTSADKTNLNTNTAKVGLIAGGIAGQALTKIDAVDYNIEWTTVDTPKLTDNIVITKTIASSAASIQVQLDALPKNLNGYTLQVNFNVGTHTLEVDLKFSRFYNGNIFILGSSASPQGIQTNIITGENIILEKLNNVNVAFKYLDFDSAPQITIADRIRFETCSFNDVAPTYSEFSETPSDLYEDDVSSMSLISTYHYNTPSSLLEISRAKVELWLKDCATPSSADRVATLIGTLGQIGFATVKYKGFNFEDIISGDPIITSNVNIILLKAEDLDIYQLDSIVEAEVLIYNNLGSVLEFRLTINGTIITTSSSLKPILDRLEADLRGATLRVIMKLTAQGNVILPIYDTSPLTAGLDFSKFYNGIIHMYSLNEVSAGDPVSFSLESTVEGFMKINSSINLNINNLIFTVPAINAVTYGITCEPDSNNNINSFQGNILVNDTKFNFLNILDGYGVFTKELRNVTCVGCEFITNTAYTDSYIFDTAAVVYPRMLEADWKFIDCITPTTAAEAYPGIYKDDTGIGSKVRGYINISGNTGFVTTTTVVNIRVIIIA